MIIKHLKSNKSWQKRSRQKDNCLFADFITYPKRGFINEKSLIAAPVGFEPTVPRVRTLRLTIWPEGYIIVNIDILTITNNM